MVRIAVTKVEHFHGHARGWVCMLMRAAVTTLVALELVDLGSLWAYSPPPPPRSKMYRFPAIFQKIWQETYPFDLLLRPRIIVDPPPSVDSCSPEQISVWSWLDFILYVTCLQTMNDSTFNPSSNFVKNKKFKIIPKRLHSNTSFYRP